MTKTSGAGPLAVLLVGPQPPPHGGISVHVATARRLLRRRGVSCRVLESGGHRARGGPLATAASVRRLLERVAAHARRGDLVHVHTNGHGVASWAVALGCGLAARGARARVLTLHSGLLPAFLAEGGPAARWLPRAALARFDRVICVNRRIHDALIEHGADRDRLAILPAHLVTPPGANVLPESVERWLASRSPLLSTALSFRPEYGFDLLLDALAALAPQNPRLGCVVMGAGDDEAAARRGAAERGLDGHLLFAGDVAHELCMAVMARSDVFVRPALQDGDAISVREALALGTLVVASDASERPAGARLHRTGDASDLARRVEEALEAGRERGARQPRAPQASGGQDGEHAGEGGGIEALLWIYRAAERRRRSRATVTRRARAALARLAGMSAREILHRSRAAARAQRDRLVARLATEESNASFLEGIGARGGSFKRHLEEVVAPRFYLPADRADRRALAELLWRRFPQWLSAAAAEAERLCAHQVEVLGHGTFDLGPVIEWNRDPVSGTTWPLEWFSSYDPLHAAVDAKRILELNRQQHLPRLGKAYLLLGEERYAREVVEQMLQWIEQNPRGRGLEWQSSLDVAIRAVSWLWALFFVLPSEALDEASALRIGKSLAAQLDWVARYPSVYTSPNTHLLGEAAALYLAGVLFVDGPRGRAWLDTGGDHLTREAERQVLDDGLHAELSPYYHCYAVDFYLQALALGRRCGRPLERRVWQRVETMVDALSHLVRADASVPLLGDDDGGRALALVTTHYAEAGDLLCAGTALFGRGEWKRQASGFREEALWLLGRDGWLTWEALPALEPAPSRTSFEDAGYVVERGGPGRAHAHLVFDRGDLGRLGGGHGHADALSVVLHAYGEDLLVDSGTAVYNAAPEWREFFRSTRAHNTLVVDGADQSEQADTFRWRRQAHAHSAGDGSWEGLELAAGEHDGYAVGPGGLVHRRRVLAVDTGYWLVLDDVRESRSGEGTAPRARHQLELCWHFAPGAEVTIERGEAGVALAAVRVGAAGLGVAVHAAGRVDARLVCGATFPPQGWVSRRYGERQPAPVLEARWSARAPACAISLLAPWHESQRARPAARARVLPLRVAGSGARHAAIALAIPHTRGEDIVVLADGLAAVETGDWRARAEMLWMRVEDDRVSRFLALGATSFVFRGETLIRSAAPVTQFWSPTQGRFVPAPDSIEELMHVRHRRDR